MNSESREWAGFHFPAGSNVISTYCPELFCNKTPHQMRLYPAALTLQTCLRGRTRRPKHLGLHSNDNSRLCPNESALRETWGCCPEDETKKLRRGMLDRGRAASGMHEWEKNPIPGLVWYLAGWAVYCRHLKSHYTHVAQPAWFPTVDQRSILRRNFYTNLFLANVDEWRCGEQRPDQWEMLTQDVWGRKGKTKRWPQTVFDTLTTCAHVEFIWVRTDSLSRQRRGLLERRAQKAQSGITD